MIKCANIKNNCFSLYSNTCSPTAGETGLLGNVEVDFGKDWREKQIEETATNKNGFHNETKGEPTFRSRLRPSSGGRYRCGAILSLSSFSGPLLMSFRASALGSTGSTPTQSRPRFTPAAFWDAASDRLALFDRPTRRFGLELDIMKRKWS